MNRNSSLFHPGAVRRFPLLLALGLLAGVIFLATPARAQFQVDPVVYKQDGEPTKDDKGNTTTKYKPHSKYKSSSWHHVTQTTNSKGQVTSEILDGGNYTQTNTYAADGTKTSTVAYNDGSETSVWIVDPNGHKRKTTHFYKHDNGTTETTTSTYIYNPQKKEDIAVHTETVTKDAAGNTTGTQVEIYNNDGVQTGGYKEDGSGKKISKYNPDTQKYETISMAFPSGHDLVKPGFRTGAAPSEMQATGFASNFSLTFGIEGRGITNGFQLNTVSAEGHDHHEPHGDISQFVRLYDGEPRHFKNGTLVAGGIPGLGVLEVKNQNQLGPAPKLFSDSFFDYSRNPDKSFAPGQTVDLHALLRSCCSFCCAQTFSRSDFNMGVSPDIALAYHLGSYCWFDVDAGLRYSYMNVDDNTGWQTTGFRTTARTTTSFTGFQSVEGGPVFVVTNPSVYNSVIPGITVPSSSAPIASKEVSVHAIRSLAISNVYLHEASIPVTFSFLGHTSPWGLFYTTGITLEVPYCDETIMTLTRHGTRTSEITDTPVKVGMMNELGVSYNFNEHFAVEAHAGYTFAGRAKVTSGNSSTNVNASSPTFGLDFKYRF